MLAKINPKFRIPVLGVVVIAIVGLVTFMVIGGESEQQQIAKKNTRKQASANTPSTTKKVSKRTTAAKKKVVRISRPGMKYRIVRVVEEPQIAPSGKLRKKTDTQKKESDASRLATK